MLNQTEKNGIMKKVLIVYIGNHLVDSVYRELADYFNKYGIQCGLCSCSVGSEESLVHGYMTWRGCLIFSTGCRQNRLNGKIGRKSERRSRCCGRNDSTVTTAPYFSKIMLHKTQHEYNTKCITTPNWVLKKP